MFRMSSQLGSRRVAIASLTVVLSLLSLPLALNAQERGGDDAGTQTIEERTSGMQQIDGFFPLYWDDSRGEIWMEIPRLDEEVLQVMGLGAGLGSNDIGLDRGALQGSRIVKFERVGPKILMVQPNYRFRASTTNTAERKAVEDAFARSVLWSFDVAAQTGDRFLVAATPFFVRDGNNLAGRLSPGSYRFDNGRSTVYLPMTMGFPSNTEIEVELTFVQQPGAGGRGGFGGGAFEGVGSVAATGEAASIRMHYSFVELPDDDYETRRQDPRAGYGGISYADYSAPLGEEMRQSFLRRHRLEKADPNAEMSEAVEPIIYYLDPGTPEPIRSALMEGARWWNEAFEAAGFIDAFQVELLPEGASSHDIRYNVINWVHRSTRGWSTGGSVTDPRTGEIIKGVVTLGSLRIRQDYMIAEGLLSPYVEGDETPPELAEWGLARIRQLSAHEVGHTIGLSHNYYNSEAGRISVLDYPHPLVTLNADGSLDYSEVYDVGIGEWDKVAINYGYREFPGGEDDPAALQAILDEAWDDDIRFMTNQDVATTAQADQWANGSDMSDELDRMMDVRAAAMSRFGERAIKTGAPMATIEEVLVPLYMHHRYQVEATASAIGGVEYVYAMRGDGRVPSQPVSADYQSRALESLLATVTPSALALPRSVLNSIPPRPPGFGRSRELFPRYTGGMFDAVTPAVVAAEHTIGNIFNAQRGARLVQQNALDPSLPGLAAVIDRVIEATFTAPVADAYEAEIRRAVTGVVVNRLTTMANGAQMPQVKAISMMKLSELQGRMGQMMAQADPSEMAHLFMLTNDVERFMNRPGAAASAPQNLAAPPGAPIGSPAFDWIWDVEPPEAWMDTFLWWN